MHLYPYQHVTDRHVTCQLLSDMLVTKKFFFLSPEDFSVCSCLDTNNLYWFKFMHTCRNNSDDVSKYTHHFHFKSIGCESLSVVDKVMILSFWEQLLSNFKNFKIITISTTVFKLLLLYYCSDDGIFKYVNENWLTDHCDDNHFVRN